MNTIFFLPETGVSAADRCADAKPVSKHGRIKRAMWEQKRDDSGMTVLCFMMDQWQVDITCNGRACYRARAKFRIKVAWLVRLLPRRSEHGHHKQKNTTHGGETRILVINSHKPKLQHAKISVQHQFLLVKNFTSTHDLAIARRYG